ncbi:MAG: ribosome biogenesis GTPase Der, partial [Candidatus Edwardsbacteria bacterium]|nr:ribosome biogenesis GTPase Der [Candidatus Edwardsbacteria bacterium]
MPIPTVAIIGRPNTGKSTLFNRILKRRAAIVDDMPGVTRDRNYALADWNGKNFYLIDTGGLVPYSHDRMEQAVARQVTAAMDESDLLLFLVDRKSGLTEVDRHIAQLIRKRGRPFILAVNKVDTARDEAEAEAYEFLKLGLGDPHLIAAGPGRNIGDLLDVIVAALPESAKAEEDDDAIRVAIMGKPNVGKSSLVNAITGQERVIVDPSPGTTRDAVDTIFNWRNRRYVLIDTAGLRRKSKVKDDLEFYTALRTEKSLERAQVGALVLDATQGLSHLDMTLAGMLDAANKAIVVAVNKWDLKTDENKANYTGWLKEQLPFMQFAEIVFTAAIRAEGTSHLLQTVTEAHTAWRKQIEPKIVNAAFEAAVQKYSPPVKRGRPIELYSITQVESMPPKFEVLTNEPKNIPFNYYRYLLNNLYDRLGMKGTPFRIYFKRAKPSKGWRERQLVEHGEKPRYR